MTCLHVRLGTYPSVAITRESSWPYRKTLDKPVIRNSLLWRLKNSTEKKFYDADTRPKLQSTSMTAEAGEEATMTAIPGTNLIKHFFVTYD
jgi:hypothetical protein